MSVLDIFTFKRDSNKVFTIENFKSVLETAKNAIIGEVKSNIPGQEKKNVVDAIVLSRIDDIKYDVSNKLVLWIIELIEDSIPTVTQLVYDFLKEKIENL